MPRISASEAQQIIADEQRQLNAAVLPPTLARIRTLMKEETFSICNVGPWPYQLERAALRLFIPAFDAKLDEDGKGHSESSPLPCIFREAKLTGGGGESPLEYSYIEDDGHAVALDLIGEGFGLPKSNSLLQYGVFVPAGAKATEAEIAEAKQRLGAYYDRLISEARDAYDKGPEERKAVISDRHLLAARIRGIDERWVHHNHSEESVRCGNCGKFNPSGVAQCQCGHVLDEKLYVQNQTRKAQLDKKIQDSLGAKKQ